MSTQMTIRVDDDLAAFVDEAARAGEGSRADVINRAIRREMQRRHAESDARIYASSTDRDLEKQLWEEMPEPLVRVTVDTQRYDLPESLVGAVREAPSAKGVALVPPNDPYLRQVDRTLLVPDPAQRRQVYRALSAPGALIVDGEVAGTWRYRRSDHEVRVEPFGGLTPTQEEAIEQRAHSLAASTGDETPAVIVLRS